jgi:hypothetical protein
MTKKPHGFLKYLAWAVLLFGLYLIAAWFYGVAYSVVHGRDYLVVLGIGPKAYAWQLGLGIALSTAGFSLMKGLSWSRYVFLVLCLLSLASFYQYLPILSVLGAYIYSDDQPSLVSTAVVIGLFSLKWVLASVIATTAVFRHFRVSNPDLGPAPDDLSE